MGKPGKRQPVAITVPASIANLGPGLDTLALAVSLYLRVRVRRAEVTIACNSARESGTAGREPD